MVDHAPITTWGQDAAVPTVTTNTTNTPVSLDLWLPTWAGEVISAYSAYNVFEPLVDSRTITSGTTIEFPVMGTIGLEDAWEAGEELMGGGSSTTKFSISLDRRPMAAHFEEDNIQLMVQQIDYRQGRARECGLRLANERDRQIARLITKGAKTSTSRQHERDGETPAADASGGLDTRYVGHSYVTLDETGTIVDTGEAKALKVLAAIEDQLVLFRELDVAEEGTYCAVSPALFHEIRRLGIADATGDFASGGSRPMFGGDTGMGASAGAPYTEAVGMAGKLRYMGVTICSSNHIASQGSAWAAAGDTNYRVDMTNVRGLIWQKGGVASIVKQGLNVKSVNDVRRNTVFTVASMYRGGGVLRPELCATIEIDPTLTS